MWNWHKDGCTDQWNRTESPETNPCIYGQVIFTMGTRTIYWGKGSPYKKLCWENWISTCKSTQVNSVSHHIEKLTQKWVRDLNVRAKIIKLSRENIGLNLCDLELGNVFLDITPKVQVTKEKQ